MIEVKNLGSYWAVRSKHRMCVAKCERCDREYIYQASNVKRESNCQICCDEDRRKHNIGDKIPNSILTVVEYVKPDKRNDEISKLKLLCECGNETIVRSGDLNGHTRSCGCLKGEKHGKSNDSLYKRFCGIKQRCYYSGHTQFSDYGGRGISICDEWLNSYSSFEKWAHENGYADNLQIDRIDNDGNYEPSNCRWVTAIENSHNNSRFGHGVHFAKSKNRWIARVTIAGKRFEFSDKYEKSVAYNKLRAFMEEKGNMLSQNAFKYKK